MAVLKNLADTYRRGNGGSECKVIRSRKPLPWNIYEQKKRESAEEATTRWRRIAFRWKYWFFVPIGGRVLSWFVKQNYKGIPRRAYNKDLELFDKAFEKSIIDWHVNVVRVGYNAGNTKEEAARYAKKKCPSAKLLRNAKNAYLTYCLNNVAYREFNSVWMYNLYTAMHEYYKDKPQFQHLVYKSSVAPVPHYAYLYPDIESGKILLLCNHTPMRGEKQ